jgi:transcriptional regulator GlxA family with amidase domain
MPKLLRSGYFPTFVAMKCYYFLGLMLLLHSCQPVPAPAVETAPVSVPAVLPNRYNVAFLVMNGTYNTELTAPFDIFQHTQYREGIKAMNVFTVANTRSPIRTFEGMRVLPDYNYLSDSLPPIDILVVPSAEHHLDTDLLDTAMLQFVQRIGQKAQWITSHCDGAFVLAKAGLLEGRVCTTFPSDVAAMRTMFPQLDIREGVWIVRDGNTITSAGGARSFEAAMYLCHLLYGPEVTARLGQGLVLDWKVEGLPLLDVTLNPSVKSPNAPKTTATR